MRRLLAICNSYFPRWKCIKYARQHFTSNRNALRGILHNDLNSFFLLFTSLPLFPEENCTATSKAAGVIFHLSLTLGLSALVSTFRPFCTPAELRISGAVFISVFSLFLSFFFLLSFLLFSFPNEPKCKGNYDSPSIPWLILHPRWNVCSCES
jgi:hypothetical protein